jgi:hypothetical protein
VRQGYVNTPSLANVTKENKNQTNSGGFEDLTSCLTRNLSEYWKILHLWSGNLNFCQFQPGPIISPVTKIAEAMN